MAPRQASPSSRTSFNTCEINAGCNANGHRGDHVLMTSLLSKTWGDLGLLPQQAVQRGPRRLLPHARATST